MRSKLLFVTVILCITFSFGFSQSVKDLRNIGLTEITIIEAANDSDLWVGSLYQGVAFYSGTNHSWQYYSSSNTPQFAITSDSITSISYGLIGGVQHVFIGTRNGLVYRKDSIWGTLPLASNLRKDRYITGVALSDSLWASTWDGIVVYDTNSLSVIADTLNRFNSLIPYNHTNCSERHGQNCVGFTVGTPDSGVFYTLNDTFAKIDTSGRHFKLVDNRVNTICMDNNCNRRLIGTMGGLSICPTGIPCYNVTTANGLPENDVTSISMDCHGNIWVGMPDSGIVVLNNMGTSVVARITTSNGLTDDSIAAISFGGGVCTGYIAMGDGNIAMVDTMYQVVHIYDGVNEISEADFNVRVYPQPSASQLTFLFARELASGEINLTDLSGRIVKNISISNSSRINIDVSSLPDGLYFYHISSDGQQLKTGKVDVMR